MDMAIAAGKGQLMSRSSQSRIRLYGPIIVIGAGVLFLASAVVLGLRSASSSPAPADSPGQAVEETFPEIPRVELADARAAFDSGAAVFVDVRDEESYTSGHVPGALSIPLAKLGTRFSELNRSDWIITYCT